MTKSRHILALAESLISLYSSVDESEKVVPLSDRVQITIDFLEAMKSVVRNGKLTKVLDCPDGYKSQRGRCVLMRPTERRNRSIAAERSQKRSRGNFGAIKTKRRHSLVVRHGMGLK